MGLFKKLFSKKEKEAKSAPVPQTEEVKTEEASAPSLNNVQAPAQPEKAPEEVKKTTEVKEIPAAKAAPAEKPAKKPAAKPAKKPADKVPGAVKLSSEPAKKAPAARTFLATTEEDVNTAFAEAIAEAEAQIQASDSKAVGKYEFNLEVDGYHFYLSANNGQVLFDSPSFTTLLGALNGIKTFKKTVAEGAFEVKVDKYNRYRFILARKYYGENYTSKDQCKNCVDSVRKFANCSKIVTYRPDAEALAAYEAAKSAKRTPDDIDWRAVDEAEAAAQKMGKFEICCEDADHFCFYLLANNGQILYSSRFYTNEAACRKGIESFKRAAYVGNFFVDRDKFGNFRYVLKNIGSAPSFIGESYDNKPQCERIIDSVKKFIVTASIEKEEENA